MYVSDCEGGEQRLKSVLLVQEARSYRWVGGQGGMGSVGKRKTMGRKVGGYAEK